MKKEFNCTINDFHPYECDSGCIHCERLLTEKHKPTECALCDDEGFRPHKKQTEDKVGDYFTDFLEESMGIKVVEVEKS